MREIGKPDEILEHLIKKNAEVRKDYNNKNQLLPNEKN